MALEAAAAVVSFVGLAGPVAQGLKFMYDLTTDMRDCPKDIQEMQTDLYLVESLITLIIKQCDSRDDRFRNKDLLRAIYHVQERVKDLGDALVAYGVGERPRPYMRFKFAGRMSQTQKLRTSLDRAKAAMMGIKSLLESDLVYDTYRNARETQAIMMERSETMHRTLASTASVENRTRNIQDDLCRLGRDYRVNLDTLDRVERSSQATNENVSDSLATIKAMDRKLDDIGAIAQLLRESSIGSCSAASSRLEGESSNTSLFSSSQESTISMASTAMTSVTISETQSRDDEHVDLRQKFPLHQFKDNTFYFLVACIFLQRTVKPKQYLVCCRAAECLSTYSTPRSLAGASASSLEDYFRGIGLQKTKPGHLIEFASMYARDPPVKGLPREKPKQKRFPRTEISHLPQVGLVALNAWLVYCCGKEVETEDEGLRGYMVHSSRMP